MEELVAYAEFIVKSICSEPDLVKVSSYEEDTNSTILEILVPNQDMSTVIGHKGKTSSSIRVLLLLYAYLHKLGKIKINFESF